MTILLTVILQLSRAIGPGCRCPRAGHQIADLVSDGQLERVERSTRLLWGQAGHRQVEDMNRLPLPAMDAVRRAPGSKWRLTTRPAVLIPA